LLIFGGIRKSGQNIIETQLFDRNRLPINSEITGLAIIEQLDSTTVIYPEQMAKIDSFGKIPAAWGGGDNVQFFAIELSTPDPYSLDTVSFFPTQRAFNDAE
jgi:hypothetical protein